LSSTRPQAERQALQKSYYELRHESLRTDSASAVPNQFTKHLLNTHTFNFLYEAISRNHPTLKSIVYAVAEFGKEEDFAMCGMDDERTNSQYNDIFVRDVMGTLVKLKSESKTLQKDGREKRYLESVWCLKDRCPFHDVA
jgi:hypothetical protein